MSAKMDILISQVRPLLPLFIEGGLSYVLALSQNLVRLLQGTHYNVNEVGLLDGPRGMDG
jgi:hypothetical protein